MTRKSIVISLVMVFVSFSSFTCWAAEKSVGDITNTQQAIDKLLTGRTLDPVEGIWVRDEQLIIAIVKTGLVSGDNPDYNNYDYVGIAVRGKKVGERIMFLKKTEFNFVFSGHKFTLAQESGYWKLLTPTLFQFDGNDGNWATKFIPQTFIRTYPAL